MTPSEEMIPRRLRFKIASHVRTADRANQLFKFGSWNRVAGNCRESGRFKKCLKKLHPTSGYHNQNLRCKSTRKTRTGDIEKSCDGQVFLCTGPGITSSKAGGPLLLSTKLLPCAKIAHAQVKTFNATAHACFYAGYSTKGLWVSFAENLVL